MLHIGPLLFLGLRTGVAALVLLPLAIREQRKPGTGITEVLPIAMPGGALFFAAAGSFSQGDLLVAISAIGWGTLIVITGKGGRLARPVTYTCLQFCFVAVLSLCLALLLEPMSLQAIINAADSILYVGVLSTALTFGIMAIALQHVPAPRASVLLRPKYCFLPLQATCCSESDYLRLAGSGP